MDDLLRLERKTGTLTKYQDTVGKSAQASLSANTQRAYRFAWERFTRWSQEKAVSPLPASVETLYAYLAGMADKGCALSSIEQALAAINKAHELKGLSSPS